MEIRTYRNDDAAAVAELSAFCTRGETDFVLNPLWETEQELHAEFARHDIAPEQHLLVAEGVSREVLGVSGFLRFDGARDAGLICPIVAKAERGHGLGGQLLRAALDLGGKLEIELATAGLGTRNRAGFALLTAFGFRPAPFRAPPQLRNGSTPAAPFAGPRRFAPPLRCTAMLIPHILSTAVARSQARTTRPPRESV